MKTLFKKVLMIGACASILGLAAPAVSAGQAIYQSFLVEDAFGLSTEFVWFENFAYLATDEQYLGSFGRTIFFSVCVAFLSMSVALVLAGFADRVVRGATTYRTTEASEILLVSR